MKQRRLKRRLLVVEGPDGKPIAFFPTDVRFLGPVNVPGKATGIVDPKDQKLKIEPTPEYRKDLCAILCVEVQAPIIAKGEVQEMATQINMKIDWAEGGQA